MNLNKVMLKLKRTNLLLTKKSYNEHLFVNITEALNTKKDNDSILNSINYQNINYILEISKNHSYVLKVRQTFMTEENFSFEFVREDIVRKKLCIQIVGRLFLIVIYPSTF